MRLVRSWLKTSPRCELAHPRAGPARLQPNDSRLEPPGRDRLSNENPREHAIPARVEPVALCRPERYQ